MIVSVDYLSSLPEFQNTSAVMLQKKLDAVEGLIRAYTNNNFQNRNIRFEGKSLGDRIFGSCPYLAVGDTVQVSASAVNDGLYTIAEIGVDFIRLNKKLNDVPLNMVTKVVYPPDIEQGVIDLMLWERENRQKVGIKSETISRYSVSYYDQDVNNQVMGYPVSLLGFLKPYMKARF